MSDLSESDQNNHHYIPVYIIETSSTESSEKISWYFSDPLFIVQVVRIEVPPDMYQQYSHLNPADVDEIYRYYWCLHNAHQKFPDNYVLVVTDQVATHSSPSEVSEIISYLRQIPQWDLCYLCKWQDRCDLYTEPITIPNKTTLVNRTSSAQGCQAILFSPSGRRLVTDEPDLYRQPLATHFYRKVAKADYQAITVNPNLFTLNLSYLNKADYSKLQECQEVTDNSTASPDDGSSNNTTTSPDDGSSNNTTASPVNSVSSLGLFFWIVLILLLIFLIWYFVR